MLVARNLNLLEEIKKSSLTGYWDTVCRANAYTPYRPPLIPTDSTVTHYQAAVVTARVEIRRLTSDFLLNSAAR